MEAGLSHLEYSYIPSWKLQLIGLAVIRVLRTNH